MGGAHDAAGLRRAAPVSAHRAHRLLHGRHRRAGRAGRARSFASAPDGASASRPRCCAACWRCSPGIAIDYPGKPTLAPREPDLSPLPGQRWSVVLRRLRQPVVLGEAVHRARHAATSPTIRASPPGCCGSRTARPCCRSSRSDSAEKPRAEWLEILAAHDIPAAPVKTIQEFMDDPGGAASRHGPRVRPSRRRSPARDGPAAGLRRDADPRSRPAAHARPAHRRGAGELGYDAAAVNDLRARKVVR